MSPHDDATGDIVRREFPNVRRWEDSVLDRLPSPALREATARFGVAGGKGGPMSDMRKDDVGSGASERAVVSVRFVLVVKLV